MAIEALNVVSISPTRPKGWRVRLFHVPADWNSLGRTLAEQKFRSESAARKWALEMAESHNAKIQG